MPRTSCGACGFAGPHFLISGATGAGTAELVQAVMSFLESTQRAAGKRRTRGEE